jgi:hypothetical protein
MSWARALGELGRRLFAGNVEGRTERCRSSSPEFGGDLVASIAASAILVTLRSESSSRTVLPLRPVLDVGDRLKRN